jgi:hypothetical protein
LLLVLDYDLLFMFFSFVGGVQHAHRLCWFMFLGVVWVGESHMFMMLTCLFCLFTCLQLWSQQRWGEVAPTFLSAAWGGEAFHGLEIQNVAEFDSD